MGNIGARILSARRAKVYTQEELAALVHTTKATISRYENELREPNVDQLAQIAKALDVHMVDLLPKTTEESLKVATRDPNRIYKFCNQLASVWATEAYDMRFGQLVKFIFHDLTKEGKDPSYMEEDEMMAAIERLLNYWP